MNFLDNRDMRGLFGGIFFINLSATDVKNLLKWLTMTLSSVVNTLFIYKLICRDFVFLLLLMIALIAFHTFFESFLFSLKKGDQY